MKQHLLLFFCLFFGKMTWAQCPQITNCPATAPTICDAGTNHPQLWRADYWLDYLHNINDLPEVAVDLSITAKDLCTTGTLIFSYELLLDLDNSGSPETLVKSQSPPPPGALYFGNLNGGTGVYRVFDQRNISPLLKYRFGLSVTGTGNTRTAQLRWKSNGTLGNGVLPQLPPGNHEIRWTVRDGAGSTTVCAYIFKIKDCQPPQVLCPDTLVVQLQGYGLATLFLDSLVEASDNLTPVDQIETSMRFGVGTSFPLQNNLMPVTRLKVNCLEANTDLKLQLWARDKYKNTAFCTTIVQVRDENGVCNGNDLYSKSICPVTVNGELIDLVTFQVQTSPNAVPSFSLGGGIQPLCFNFSAFPNITTNLTNTGPYLQLIKDNFGENGVSVQDVARIGAHLNGTQPFEFPWQWIAADVNNDKQVTQEDRNVLLQMLSIGSGEFPNNTSWRFYRSDYVFPSGNPLAVPYPETLPLAALLPLPVGTAFEMIGVKIGDVTGNALPELDAPVSDRALAQAAGARAIPNPFSAEVTLQIPSDTGGAAQVALWDASGRNLYRQTLQVPAGGITCPLSADIFGGEGLYFWQVELNGEVFAGTLIKR